MTHWLILRTDPRKEHYVAAQIEKADFVAWVPSRVVVIRSAAGRRITAKAKERLPTKEYPLLPGVLFAAVPGALEAELKGIKHVNEVLHRRDGTLAEVPDKQVMAFMLAVDKVNQKMRNFAAATMTKKEKQAWMPIQDLAKVLEQRARENEQTLEEAA